MWDDLCAVRAAIYGEPVTFLRDALFFRDLFGYQQHLAGQRLVGICETVDRGDMLFGYEHIVHRRHRVYIAEGEEIIIAINQVCGDAAGRDLAEYAVHVGSYQAMRIVWQVVVRSMPLIL